MPGCYSGNDGVVKVGTSPVGEMVSWDVEETAETYDCTTMGDEWERHIAGRKKWTASITLRWDPNDAGQTALTVGTAVSLKLYPAGDATGSEQLSGNATVTKVGRSVNKDDVVERTIELAGNGALTIGTAP